MFCQEFLEFEKHVVLLNLGRMMCFREEMHTPPAFCKQNYLHAVAL